MTTSEASSTPLTRQSHTQASNPLTYADCPETPANETTTRCAQNVARAYRTLATRLLKQALHSNAFMDAMGWLYMNGCYVVLDDDGVPTQGVASAWVKDDVLTPYLIAPVYSRRDNTLVTYVSLRLAPGAKDDFGNPMAALARLPNPETWVRFQRRLNVNYWRSLAEVKRENPEWAQPHDNGDAMMRRLQAETFLKIERTIAVDPDDVSLTCAAWSQG